MPYHFGLPYDEVECESSKEGDDHESGKGLRRSIWALGSLRRCRSDHRCNGATTGLVADKDNDGFFISSQERFEQSSYAISADVEIASDAPRWLAEWISDIGEVRVTGSSNTASEIFIGVAATDDVEGYLSGVAYGEVEDIEYNPFNIDYLSHDGTATPSAPTDQVFWVERTSGSQEQTLDWAIEPGNWSVVVMNADGSPFVDTDLVFGMNVNNATAFIWLTMAVGAAFGLAGLVLLYLGMRRSPTTYHPAPERRVPSQAGSSGR